MSAKSRRYSDQSNRLTGPPRRLKDLTADLYNNIQKWKSLNNSGFNIASSIVNIKISSRSQYVEKYPNKLKGVRVSEIDSCYPKEMESICNDLKDLYNSMKILADKINKISIQMEKTGEIDMNMSGDTGFELNRGPFKLWPSSKFGEIAKDINKLFQEEIRLKRVIVENIAHSDVLFDENIRPLDDSRDITMVYMACWLHEPYRHEQEIELLLTELLMETGHK